MLSINPSYCEPLTVDDFALIMIINFHSVTFDFKKKLKLKAFMKGYQRLFFLKNSLLILNKLKGKHI